VSYATCPTLVQSVQHGAWNQGATKMTPTSADKKKPRCYIVARFDFKIYQNFEKDITFNLERKPMC
jgi:hypothetical protein